MNQHDPNQHPIVPPFPESSWTPLPKKSHKLRTAAIVTVSVLGGLFVFAGIVGAVTGGSSEAPVSVTAGSPTAASTVTVPTTEVPVAVDPTPPPAPKPTKTTPARTAGQEQAIGLEMTHFSRAGLIQQLESSAGEGFTHKQAVYGVSKAGL